MIYKTLISVDELNTNINQDDFLIVDCRFDLIDTNQGRTVYAQSHLPHAVYAHLDEDLSGEIIKGKTGRHPLPEVAAINKLFSSWGITKSTQVIAYDNVTGPFAARLWWMLRWAGHEKVAVLDGGFKHWEAKGLALENSVNHAKTTSQFEADFQSEMLVDAAYVMAQSCAKKSEEKTCLLDARPADRYCGQNETMDAKAGHIPGAISVPFFTNLTDTGCLKNKEELFASYQEKMKGVSASNTIVYCGSGVTAAHNLLAMEVCELTDAKNYAGSWSDWINDNNHPVETC